MPLRIAAFVLLFGIGLLFPWFVFAPLMVGYVLRWRGFELLAIALCIDALYGAHGFLGGFFYIALTVAALAAAELAKPMLRFYTA
jgi:hypothetical protein